MKHSKREYLTTEDVTNALRLRKVEVLYGFSSKEPTKYAKLEGKEDVYIVEPKIVDLETVLDEPLPEVPRDTAFTVHWLAIEGVQPSIPQNPRM